MADNTTTNPGSGGDNIATDELATINGAVATGGVKVQRAKVGFGSDGTFRDVDANNGLPISGTGELIEAIEDMRIAIFSLVHTVGQVLPDASGRQRVVIDAITAALTLANITTVSTVTTVTTLGNQTQIGGLNANDQLPALMRMAADNLTRNVLVS